MTVKTQPENEASEAVSMILMVIMTFLVVVLTYKWFRSRIWGGERQAPTKDNKTGQSKSKTTITAKGDAAKETATNLETTRDEDDDEDDDEDFSNMDDVLVKASDIKPLDEAMLQQMGQNASESPKMAEVTDDGHKHPKAKELEEEVAKNLSQDQLEEETKVRQNQLAAIFKLMEENKDRFGVDSVNDVTEQYKLYVH